MARPASEKKKAYQKRYYKINREKHRADMRAWWIKNGPKILPRLRAKRRQIRQAIFRALGNKCVWCGFQDHRALQIDHVNNNGAQHRRQYPVGSSIYYKDILANIDSGQYQCLCANCNYIKKVEHEEGKRND